VQGTTVLAGGCWLLLLVPEPWSRWTGDRCGRVAVPGGLVAGRLCVVPGGGGVAGSYSS
jgi:hypothetical protein